MTWFWEILGNCQGLTYGYFIVQKYSNGFFRYLNMHLNKVEINKKYFVKRQGLTKK